MSQWLLRFFMKRFYTTAFSNTIELPPKPFKCQKEGIVAFDRDFFDFLIETYTTHDVIAEVDGK